MSYEATRAAQSTGLTVLDLPSRSTATQPVTFQVTQHSPPPSTLIPSTFPEETDDLLLPEEGQKATATKGTANKESKQEPNPIASIPIKADDVTSSRRVRGMSDIECSPLMGMGSRSNAELDVKLISSRTNSLMPQYE